MKPYIQCDFSWHMTYPPLTGAEMKGRRLTWVWLRCGAKTDGARAAEAGDGARGDGARADGDSGARLVQAATQPPTQSWRGSRPQPVLPPQLPQPLRIPEAKLEAHLSPWSVSRLPPPLQVSKCVHRPSQGPSHCLPPVLPNMSSVSWACQDFGSLFIRPLLPHLQRLCSTAFFPECLSCWSQQATACPSPSPEVRSTTSIWGLKLHVWVRCSPGREQLFLLTSNFFFMPHHLSHFQVSANCLPKTPQRLIHLHLYLLFKKILRRGLPCCLSGKESACQCRRHGFDPWSKKIPHAYKQLSPSTTPPEPVL